MNTELYVTTSRQERDYLTDALAEQGISCRREVRMGRKSDFFVVLVAESDIDVAVRIRERIDWSLIPDGNDPQFQMISDIADKLIDLQRSAQEYGNGTLAKQTDTLYEQVLELRKLVTARQQTPLQGA